MYLASNFTTSAKYPEFYCIYYQLGTERQKLKAQPARCLP